MLDQVIRLRRTIKPEKMNGGVIPDESIDKLLELADWAPTHARTEPWRFVVYGHDKISDFCREHAMLYRDYTAPDKFKEPVYERMLKACEGASHVIIGYMKRGSNPNIPEIEEVASTAAAIQNMLIGATELGIASFWSTGGMAHHESFKHYLGLAEEDKVLGIFYLGYPLEEFKEGKRSISLSEKIRWVK